MHYSTGNKTVDAIGGLHFHGNIVPHTWYQHIKYTNKRGEKTDHLACLILAEIVYWYRPTEDSDTTTGHLIGYRKKFAEDKLQKTPEAFAELFGCTPKVARESLALLEKLDLIDIELKPVKTAFGVIPRAMFIGLNAERVSAITRSSSKAEILEESLLPKSARRNAEIGKTEFRNRQDEMPKSVSSLYIESSHRFNTKYAYSPDSRTREKNELEERPKSGSAQTLENAENAEREKPIPTNKGIKKPEIPVNTSDSIPTSVEAEAPKLTTRRIHPVKKTECSDSRDPWMDGMNPVPEFKEWLYELRKKEGFESASPANAASEIRNDYLRAKDLWEEFQRSTKGIVGGVEYTDEDYEKLLASCRDEFDFIWMMDGVTKQEGERRLAWLENREKVLAEKAEVEKAEADSDANSLT